MERLSLTSKQSATYSFVLAHIASTGHPPTVRELAANERVTRPTAYERIKAVCEKGYLAMVGKRKSRNLVVIEPIAAHYAKGIDLNVIPTIPDDASLRPASTSDATPYASAANDSLLCPLCDKGGTRVINSRYVTSYDGVSRRRECQNCGHRWTTIEICADRIEEMRHNDDATELAELRQCIKTMFVSAWKHNV